MAVRPLGSSLLAKAGAGGRLRESEEARIQKPEIPGKGGIGTLGRAQVEEPLVRQVPAGSSKVVSVQPTVEGTTADVGILPTAPRAEARPGSQNQALFQGGIGEAGQAPATGVPTSRVQSGRGAAVTSSVGGEARPATGNQRLAGGAVNIQGEKGGQLRSSQAPSVNTVGNRAILNPKEPIKPISGGITSQTNLRSGAVITPTPTPTPTRPTPTPVRPNPVPTPALPLQNIMNSIFGTAKSTPNIDFGAGLRSLAQNVVGNLRSKFGLFGGKR